jgi:hypothetical protein
MKKSTLTTSVFFVLMGCFLVLGLTGPEQDGKIQLEKNKSETGKIWADRDWGNIPLYFIPNKGQVNEEALFYTKTSRYTLWLTKDSLIFDSSIKQNETSEIKADNNPESRSHELETSPD